MISFEARRDRDVLALPAHLLRRELERNRTAPRLYSDGCPTPETDGLRKMAEQMLTEMDADPAAFRADLQRATCRLQTTTALLVADRLVPTPNGVSEEVFGGSVRRARICASDFRHPDESVKICLRAAPERESFRDRDGQLPHCPEWHYDRETLLLMQQLEITVPALELRPEPTTVLLRDAARDLLDHMHAVPAAYRLQPSRTRLRLLGLAVMVAADRMLSSDPDLRYSHLRHPVRLVGITRRAYGNLPDAFQMRLQYDIAAN